MAAVVASSRPCPGADPAVASLLPSRVELSSCPAPPDDRLELRLPELRVRAMMSSAAYTPSSCRANTSAKAISGRDCLCSVKIIIRMNASHAFKPIGCAVYIMRSARNYVGEVRCECYSAHLGYSGVEVRRLFYEGGHAVEEERREVRPAAGHEVLATSAQGQPLTCARGQFHRMRVVHDGTWQ
jgi:hypothetical protein